MAGTNKAQRASPELQSVLGPLRGAKCESRVHCKIRNGMVVEGSVAASRVQQPRMLLLRLLLRLLLLPIFLAAILRDGLGHNQGYTRQEG